MWETVFYVGRVAHAFAFAYQRGECGGRRRRGGKFGERGGAAATFGGDVAVRGGWWGRWVSSRVAADAVGASARGWISAGRGGTVFFRDGGDAADAATDEVRFSTAVSWGKGGRRASGYAESIPARRVLSGTAWE